MSEHDLLNYNIFKSSNTVGSLPPFNFDYTIPTTTTASILPNQQRNIQYTALHHNNNYLPPISTSPFNPVIHKKVLDQSEQWKSDVPQSFLIINDPPPTSPPLIISRKRGLEPDEQTPTHIVSPEAIQEALKEEKEEAMGSSRRRPFSQFSSFHALKQRRYSTDLLSPPLPPTPTTTTASFPIPFSPPPSVGTRNEDMEAYGMNDNDNDEVEEQAETLPNADQQQSSSSSSKTAVLEKLKRPPNAYLLFNRDMRRKLLKQSPKMTVAEISKEIGDWWKALPDDKREYYVKEASLLKEEHLKKHPDFIYTRRSKAQLAEAKKTSKLGRKSKPVATTASTADAASTSSSSVFADPSSPPKKKARKFISADGQRDPRGRKKKRHKHPFAPKHPMSAYLYYLASVYPKVSLNFPGSTVGPISKSISKTWHSMTPEEQLPWKQMAESDKARYAREMQVYIANNNNNDSGSNITTSAEEKAAEAPLSEEDSDTDVDVNTLATVVNMINHNSNGRATA